MSLAATTPKTDLNRALAIAKVAASLDKTLAMLHAVNLTITTRGNLVVQGSDRYIAVRAHLPAQGLTYDDHITEGKLTVSLQQVGLIQKWLTLLDKSAEVHITHTAEHGLAVSAEGAPTLSGITPIEGTFPNLEKLLRADEAVDYQVHDRAGAVILATRNATKLGTIAGYCKRRTPLLLRPGTKGTTSGNDLLFRFSDGDTITADGMIMGIRVHPGDILNQHGL